MSEKEAGSRAFTTRKCEKSGHVVIVIPTDENIDGGKEPCVRFDLPVSIQVPPRRTTHRNPSTWSSGARDPPAPAPAPEGGHGMVLSAVDNTPFWRAYVSRTTGRKSEAETIAKT